MIDNAREAERIMPGRPLAIALDTVSPGESDSVAVFSDEFGGNRKVPKSGRVTL